MDTSRRIVIGVTPVDRNATSGIMVEAHGYRLVDGGTVPIAHELLGRAFLLWGCHFTELRDGIDQVWHRYGAHAIVIAAKLISDGAVAEEGVVTGIETHCKGIPVVVVADALSWEAIPFQEVLMAYC